MRYIKLLAIITILNLSIVLQREIDDNDKSFLNDLTMNNLNELNGTLEQATGDNKYLIGADYNNVIVWDINTSEEKKRISLERQVFALILLHTPNHIAVGLNEFIHIINIETEKIIQTIYKKNRRFDCLFALRKNNFMSSDNLGTINVFNYITGEEIQEIDGHEGGFSKYPFLMHGLKSDILVTVYKPTIEVKNLSSNQSTTLYGHSEDIYDLTPINKELFASASFDGTVKIWNTNDMGLVKTFSNTDEKRKYFRGFVSVIVMGGENIAAGGIDGYVRIWNINTEELVIKFNTNDWVNYMTVLDHSLMAVSGNERSVKIYNYKTGEFVKTIHKGDGYGIVHGLILY